MALYIPHSIFHLARLLYVRPETFGPYYVYIYIHTHTHTHTHTHLYTLHGGLTRCKVFNLDYFLLFTNFIYIIVNSHLLFLKLRESQVSWPWH